MLEVQASGPLVGEIRPPSDKSITHRALMLASVALGGKSTVYHPLDAGDCRSTASCLRALGAEIDWPYGGVVSITPNPWTTPEEPLDCGNSGTTMRLLSGLIASRDIQALLIGDESLSKRPMRRIAEPLRLMGAELEGETPPLRIKGSSNLSPIDYLTPVASAQIKSAVLFAALRTSGTTRVTEPALSRDHTERMLRGLGVGLKDIAGGVAIEGPQEIQSFSMTVPADISSAAFFMVAAALVPDSRVQLLSVGTNKTRTGILDVFEQVGIPVEIQNLEEELGEPVANLTVSFQSELSPFIIEGDLVPRLIDEIPILAVLATQIEGTSIIRDAKELRVKESDRIELVAANLRAMGARVDTFDDGMAITGKSRLSGVKIQSNHDHRIAMAFAVAGLVADGTTRIQGSEAIDTSYPEFRAHLKMLLGKST